MLKIKPYQLGLLLFMLSIIIGSSVYLFSIFNNNPVTSTAAVVGSIPNLEAYYAFDEGTGVTSSDSTTGKTATMTNGPMWATGKAGTAIYLDGINDYITTNYSPKFNTTGFTISLWVNPSSSATSSLYRDLVGDNGYDNKGIRISGDNSKLDVLLGGSTGGSDAVRDIAINLGVGTWQMVTVSYDATSKTVVVYKNGVQVSSSVLSASNADWIGNATFSKRLISNEYLNGVIDEARFYNRPLSASEITNLYSMDLGPITVIASTSPTPTPSTSPTDTTSPVISAATTSILTANSIKISWTTNEASDTQVEYGTTTSYGSSSTLATSKVLPHSVTLTNLVPATTYYIKMKSRDAAGNLGVSTIVFTADTIAPVISVINSSWLASTTNTITWKTNEASDRQVEYGLTDIYGYSSTLNTSKSTSHSVTLANLNPGATYYLKLKSKDATGNLGVSTMTITPDTTAPITTASSTSLITATSSKISWTTNEASDTQIEYGISTDYGSTSPLNTSKVTSHSVSITGLIPETTYYVKMKSRDGSGNLGVSTMKFKTGLSYQADLPLSFVYIGHPFLSRFPTDTKNRWISDMQYWPLTNKIYIGSGDTSNNTTRTDLWSLNASTKVFVKEVSQINLEMIERFRILAGQMYIPAYDDVNGLNFYRLATSTWKYHLVSVPFTGHSPDIAVFDNKIFVPVGRSDITKPNIATTDLQGIVTYLPTSTTTHNTEGRVENFFEFKGKLYVNKLPSLSTTTDTVFLSRYSTTSPTQYITVHPTGGAFFPETNKHADATYMHKAINFKGAIVYGGFINLHYATSIEPPVANVISFPDSAMSVTDFFERDGLMFVLGRNSNNKYVLASPDLVNWTTLLQVSSPTISFSSAEYAGGNIYLSAAIYSSNASTTANSLKYTGAIYSVNSSNFLNPLPSNTPTVPGVI